MPFDENGEWIDDPYAPLSPWETAHGGVPYDPGATERNAPNDFDRYVEDLYKQDPTGQGPTGAGVNLYDPSTFSRWPGPTSGQEDPQPDPTGTGTGGPLTPPPGGTTGGGTGGVGSYGTPGTFTVSPSWPMFHAPAVPTIAPLQAPTPFSYESYAAPEPFSYDAFSAPTLEQAQNEPGYAFAREEGLRALQNSASARGTLRTGGTLKDLIGWGNRFAEQNYGNVYTRAANTYGLNRANAFDTWSANELARAQTYDRNRSNAADAYKTNWGITTDVYDRNAGTALDLFDRQFRNAIAEFNPQFDAAKTTFLDIYNRDRDKLDAVTRIAAAGAGGV